MNLYVDMTLLESKGTLFKRLFLFSPELYVFKCLFGKIPFYIVSMKTRVSRHSVVLLVRK